MCVCRWGLTALGGESGEASAVTRLRMTSIVPKHVHTASAGIPFFFFWPTRLPRPSQDEGASREERARARPSGRGTHRLAPLVHPYTPPPPPPHRRCSPSPTDCGSSSPPSKRRARTAHDKRTLDGISTIQSPLRVLTVGESRLSRGAFAASQGRSSLRSQHTHTQTHTHYKAGSPPSARNSTVARARLPQTGRISGRFHGSKRFRLVRVSGGGGTAV